MESTDLRFLFFSPSSTSTGGYSFKSKLILFELFFLYSLNSLYKILCMCVPSSDDGGIPPPDDGGVPSFDDSDVPSPDDSGVSPPGDSGVSFFGDGGVPPLDDDRDASLPADVDDIL